MQRETESDSHEKERASTREQGEAALCSWVGEMSYITTQRISHYKENIER